MQAGVCRGHVCVCGLAKMHPAVGCLHLTIKQLVRGAKAYAIVCVCVCAFVCNFWACFKPSRRERTRNPNCKINHTHTRALTRSRPRRQPGRQGQAGRGQGESRLKPLNRVKRSSSADRERPEAAAKQPKD